MRWLPWIVGLVLKCWCTSDFRKRVLSDQSFLCLVLDNMLCRGHLITLSVSQMSSNVDWMSQKFILYNIGQLKLKKKKQAPNTLSQCEFWTPKRSQVLVSHLLIDPFVHIFSFNYALSQSYCIRLHMVFLGASRYPSPYFTKKLKQECCIIIIPSSSVCFYLQTTLTL